MRYLRLACGLLWLDARRAMAFMSEALASTLLPRSSRLPLLPMYTWLDGPTEQRARRVRFTPNVRSSNLSSLTVYISI
ncbi:hypothetical protein K523DRAFT_323719 [Schizophyllum commune Tattone D]|nr:hypothetical protein K523DRAFT_323719 [Schizophyllum commune Tattone D]